MFPKFAALLKSISVEVKELRATVSRMEKVKLIVKDGKDGKDGESPKVGDLVAAVLAEIPTPKDGKSPDVKAIVAKVLAQVPKPRDGRDAPQVSVSDVAAVVLAKIPKPKDGRNGPDLGTVVRQVKAQAQDGKDGPRGPKGPKGNKGTSVTNVELNNNELFVFLDGVKKLVGKIKIPAASAPFMPGGGGGLRTPLPADNARVGLFDYNDAATQTTPLVIPTGLVNVDITNDELGPFTNKAFAPKGISDVWDASTNRFDWTPLKLGDMVDIRLDIVVTTSAPNQRVVIELLVGEGPGEYVIPFLDIAVKTTGEYKVNIYNGIYLGDLNTLDNPAKFRIRSDAAATAVVNGWYVKVLIRG